MNTSNTYGNLISVYGHKNSIATLPNTIKPCKVPVTYTIQTTTTAASNEPRRQVSVTTHLYNKHAHVYTILYNGFQKCTLIASLLLM